MSFRSSTTAARKRADRPVRRSNRQAGSRKVAGLLLLALFLLLSGCAQFTGGPLPQAPGTPPQASIPNVPFYPQEQYQCGPAALAMALGWSGLDLTPQNLSSEVYTPDRQGSLQSALTGAARRHGRVAYPLSGSAALLGEIAAGHPVIVLVNLGLAWYPKWHYAVVTGYDQLDQQITLHSGLIADEIISDRVFMNLWRRSDFWGLLVLPPEMLPANAEELTWLEAVAGLEQVGRWADAATGYATALGRWPQSYAAWMGLGNCRYQLHELAGAAESFTAATRLQPDNGLAYNNLANVLLQQGRNQEALAAAQRAVNLGGPSIESFRETLREIENHRRNVP